MTHKKPIRIIAALVALFFTWTLAGGASAAHAAKLATQETAAAPTASVKRADAGEKFSRSVADVEALLDDDSLSHATRQREVKVRRAELVTTSAELRNEFSATQKKLKTAKLPPEILERQKRFVDQFEENLATLTDELTVIESAKDEVASRDAIAKAREHLVRNKAPSRHQSLDPNKLPHRQPKVQKRDPRLYKEEFEWDLKKDKNAWRSQKRIMVASSGSLAGLLAPDELAETTEVQFTLEIRAKAAELEHNPIKIYEWVHNNIEFVPTWGSIQGSQLTILTRQGNAFDIASLLIALLRASDIPARYVVGTIELPIDRLMNWAGGFTDPQAALNYIASGGVPIKGVISGGKISKAQLEHVWVETYVPYGNYRGTMKDQSIPTWIPLDASFKQYSRVTGFDVTAAVPFSQTDYLSRPSTQNSLHYYQAQIQAYLDATLPDKSIIDVKGERAIAEETFRFLPSGLPYKTLVVAEKPSVLDLSLRPKITFRVASSDNTTAATYAASSPELAGKRITVSYRPATPSDETLVTAYGGFLYNVPAYMLRVKPEIRVEGVVVATGEATTLGDEQFLKMKFAGPSGMGEEVQKTLVAGGYYAVGINLAGINEGSLGDRNGALLNNIATLSPQAFTNDDLIGEHLHLLSQTYFYANDKIYSSGAKIYNVAQMRTLSGNFVAVVPAVTYVFSIPRSVTPSGLQMDVKMDRIIAVARDGNLQAEKTYMEMSGLVSSFNEHYIFEAIDGFSSVSAVKALQTANENGIAIYDISAANIGQILPLLQVSPEVVSDIKNAANAGKEITVSQRNVQIDDWNGLGYIVKDPATGSGAYMISGGLAGGGTTKKSDGNQIVQLFKGAYGWIKDSIDLLTRNTIIFAASAEEGEGGMSDEDVAQKIANNSCSYIGKSYNNIGKCTGLVVKAYYVSGIDLTKLATDNKIDNPSYVPNLYKLVNKLHINNSVRNTNDALVGDIIFWNYTHDRNGNCKLSDDEQPTHVGIVTKVDIDGKGTINLIHASFTKGVVDKDKQGDLIMNIEYPSNIKFNSYLRNAPKEGGCPEDGSTKLTGELFEGFGTIR